MNYKTIDEIHHFNFSEAHIADVQVTDSMFHLILDNVTILPENSCNRDIREMRTNGLLFKIEESQICSIIEEGYKIYDANGNLKENHEDIAISEADYTNTAKSFAEGIIYQLEKKESQYIFYIDAENERTYQMCVIGSHDIQEWDRFFNK
ncbi:MAG: subtilin biosynthesis sensor protein SpaK [Lachnospiraceae bacterium]|nr:subtilin biosynthesis sensor protein SpaK [Lachnospiraceae bacterium]